MEKDEVWVRQKFGKWEERIVEDEPALFRRRFYCTCCGGWNTYGKTNYCPKCGAKMDWEE